MREPPGVQASVFADVIQQWANIVGADNVYTDDRDLEAYRDRYSVFWGEPDERLASAAVAPGAVEQVQQIVRLANQRRIPLYPISTGNNLGYGGSAPAYAGSVVLDLKRMNRIIEVNQELRYAIVEPGVSFFDLYRYLQELPVKLYPSVPATGWGSPIGNSLDHGIGGPAGDHFGNHCGMEVVLANGDLVRLGMGALPTAKSWALFRHAYGPTLDGIFSQSNFGIVTKMGFNLFRAPESQRSLAVASRNHDDLAQMLSLTRRLDAAGIAGEPGLSSPLLNARDANVVALRARAGGGSAREWNELARAKNLDVYRLAFALAGPRRIVDARLEVVKETFAAAMPGVVVAETTPPGGVAQIPGTPAMRNFWPDLGVRGWTGHVWFSPLVPRMAEELHRANRVFGETCRQLGAADWGWQGGLTPYRHHAMMLYSFNVTKDPAENRRTREAFLRLVRVGTENGWSEYRTAPAFMDAIASVFSFNNGALLRLQESLKDGLDPNGILSAGRYGIWPKPLREARGSSGRS